MSKALAAALALLAAHALAADPSAATSTARSSATAPAALLAELDAAYARRDEPAQLALEREKLAEAEKLAPEDYEVLWRLSRVYFWLSDDPKIDDKEKSRLGKMGWDYGDRATAANPARVEGWHFAAAGAGNYSLGLGIITALRQGLEGKFKERLARAEQLDPEFQNGGIQAAWGRFYYKLPWPKYDPRKSEEYFRKALAKNPANVRAHVYFSELLAKEDRGPEAAAELQAALANPPGRYDAPEERRWQEVAKRLVAGK